MQNYQQSNFYLEASINSFTMVSEDLSVRINGVTSHVDHAAANTSLSVLYQGFHLLVDAGSGVEESIKRGAVSNKHSPDAILITHARRHHIHDLPRLIEIGRASCRERV